MILLNRQIFVIDDRGIANLAIGCGFRLSVGGAQGSTPWGIVGLVILAQSVVLVLLAHPGKEASMGKLFFSSVLQTVSAFQINIIAGLLLPT